MIDDHQRELYREQWFAGAWGRFVRVVAALSAAAVLIAACLEIARSF